MANRKTKEIHIHRLDCIRTTCMISYMSRKNKKILHCWQLKHWLKKGYNGCHYCLREYHTD